MPSKVIAILALCLSALGCGSDNSSAPGADETSSGSGKLKIVATTGHVADALKRITEGTGAEIKLLCGPGVDPHSYAASTADVQAMVDANVVFYNGFHLEAKLHELLHHQFGNKAWPMADAFPNEARLDWIEDGKQDPEAPFDPHIWNHLPGWSKCVSELAEQLASRDDANAETYRKNGAGYVAEIIAAHESAVKRFDEIPKERRVIVSAHDAFGYFAKVYDFRSEAVLGVGNDAEADLKTMREVATKVSDWQVPVVFIENITNPKVTKALQEACAARSWSVRIADEPLYSDDLGTNPPTNTYLGAFKHNVELIANSLKPKT